MASDSIAVLPAGPPGAAEAAGVTEKGPGQEEGQGTHEATLPRTCGGTEAHRGADRALSRGDH